MHKIMLDILEKKKEDISSLYTASGLETMKLQCQSLPSSNGKFFDALNKNTLSVIAELKKASPSKGIINSDFNPIELALTFEKMGASALSILTETHYFLGNPSYIKEVKNNVNLPVIRKDFILDPIQVYESKLLGADAILLIMAFLTPNLAQELIQTATDLGLDVLLEIHTQEEFEQAKQLKGVRMLGVNNRDLKSFTVNQELALTLIDRIKSESPQFQVRVAESGYSKKESLLELQNKGFNAVLIGEGLVKAPELMQL